MRWSFIIARITGIQIRIHLSFLLFLGWVGFSNGLESGWRASAGGVVLVLLVFSCILLHELGHAWAARRFGIRTPDITLLPIGGIARLERIPERPQEEIIVALAGPAVTALLALFFGALCGFRLPTMTGDLQGWSDFAAKLFTVNTGLLLFNLLPVFPMDGGRVFRALLALRLSYRRSTHIAAIVGQSLAVLLGLAGVWLPAPMLLLVAVFVFFGAGSEASQVDVREASRGLRVQDAMLTKFTPLPAEAQLADAADLLLHSSQHTFPLADAQGLFVGLLTRNSLIGGLNEAGPLGAALPYARTDLPAVAPTHLLSHACSLMQEFDTPALPVLNAEGGLIGLFTQENLSELLIMESTARSRFFPWIRRRSKQE